MKNAYEVLQVAESASTEIVELVYKRLVFNEHPDRAANKTRAEALLKEINWAFGVISDPEKRAAHDRELAVARFPAPALVAPKKKRKKKQIAAEPVQVQYIYVPVPVPAPRGRYESVVRIHSAADEDDEGMTVSIHR